MKGAVRRSISLITLGLSLFALSSKAVVFFSTADPNYNSVRPTNDLAANVWDLQGSWVGYLGTPIASNLFITATHVGGTTNNTFVLNSTTNRVTTFFKHKHADLTIWRIEGVFTNYAQLFEGTNELGEPFVVFGRGWQRGTEVRVDNKLRGWRWGINDGRVRWGENEVHAITTHRGAPITNSTQLQFLHALFNTNAGPNEAHLAAGDSGGGLFIQQQGVCTLAGINQSVDGEYSTNASGPGFDAAIFDERGLYQGRSTNWVLQTGTEIQPGGFYATRISAYRDWIDRIIQFGNPFGQVVVETTPALDQPFTAAQAVEVDLELQKVQLPLTATNEFIRLRSFAPIAITSLTNTPSSIVLQFEEK